MTGTQWTARILIGCVFFFNVQCALAFLIAPQVYAPGFELGGAAGKGMVQGMGILFLMWNVPYAVALSNPIRQCTSLIEAVVMQAIGLCGESLLLAALEPGHLTLRGSVLRFILFDGAGLLALLLAWLLTTRWNPSASAPAPSRRI